MSDARKTAAPAISSTCPGRPIGMPGAVSGDSAPPDISTSPSVRVRSGGASAFTRMPCGDSSNDAVCV